MKKHLISLLVVILLGWRQVASFSPWCRASRRTGGFFLSMTTTTTAAQTPRVITKISFRFPEKVRLFSQYRKIHGNLKIQADYKIPKSDEEDEQRREEAKLWPAEAQGVALGHIAKKLRTYSKEKYASEYPQDFEALIQMGYQWQSSNPAWSYPDRVAMLQKFKDIHGHINIPRKYIIPANDSSWPSKYADINLSNIAINLLESNVEMQRKYPEEYQVVQDLKAFRQHGRSKSIFNEHRSPAAINRTIAIFTHYYKLHQNLEIPFHLVIPKNATEWPEDFHGFRLGAYSVLVRSSGESYCRNNVPKLYEALQKMEFRWEARLKAPSYEERMKLLRAHYQRYHHLDIRSTTEVPHEVRRNQSALDYYGVHLNQLAESMRYRKKQYLQQYYPNFYEELEAMGFRWTKFKPGKLLHAPETLQLFQIYHQVYQHLNIPYTFRIPYNDTRWPEEHWGKPLWFKASTLRKSGREFYEARDANFVAALDAMNFSWALTIYRKSQYELELIQACKDRYGRDYMSVIDEDFVVPRNDSTWPIYFQGAEVGKLIHARKNITSVQLYNRRRPSAMYTKRQEEEKKWLPVVEHYLALNGGMLVKLPSSYITPNDDKRWTDVGLHNLPLGNFIAKLYDIGEASSQVKYPALHAKLKEAQFRWKQNIPVGGTGLQFVKKVAALLQKYYELYGDSLVKLTFVVPKDDVRWPEEFRGERLGQMVAQTRQRGQDYYLKKYPQFASVFDEIGFVWRIKLRTTFEEKFHILKKYHELFGNLRIRDGYVVPGKEGDKWPKEMWGVNLVFLRNNLAITPEQGKFRQLYPEMCAELEKMGFKWKAPVYTNVKTVKSPNKVSAMLQKYYELYGDSLVKYAFVVPMDDERWPKEFRGEKLGQMVSYLRQRGQDCYLKRYPQCASVFDEIGFAWKIHEKRTPFEEKFHILKKYHELFGNLRISAGYVIPGKEGDKWPKDMWGVNLMFLRNNLAITPEQGKFRQLYPEMCAELEKMGFKWRAPVYTNVKKVKD